MNITPAGGGFAAKCPVCVWRTFSQTKAVVAARVAVHETECVNRIKAVK